MNFWDILLLLAVAGMVALAVRQIAKNKGSCSCGCGGTCSGNCAACGRSCGKRRQSGKK